MTCPTAKGGGLGWLFHPRSVAIVGVSADADNWGKIWLSNLIAAGFKGELYPVHLEASEVMGFKVYRNLAEIPGAVDYVISSIRAEAIPQLVEECIQKGVRALHLFTAGFSETGQDDRIQLEKQLVVKARRGGLRILGPNCMGIYCPSTGLTFDHTLSRESGPVGLLSQSGGNAREIGWSGLVRNIKFSKVVSYGNASDLTESDYLEYFVHDPETKIIAAYIEGIRDGRRFYRLLGEACRQKPVIVLKGGRTKAGERAGSSHTAALAGSEVAWEALFKQTGALRVYSLSEMADVILAFLYLRVPKGRRIAVVGAGGGASVIGADDCVAAGFELPILEPEVQAALAGLMPLAGTSVRNPVDCGAPTNPDILAEAVRIVANSPTVDAIIAHVLLDFSLTLPEGRSILDMMVDGLIGAGKNIGKPMVIVLGSSGVPKSAQALADLQEKCLKVGFPVYPSIASAARAMSGLIRYHERFMGEGSS